MSERFAGVRGAVIQALKTEFSLLKTVKAHGGPIDLIELERFSIRSPEVRVAWVGTTVARDISQRATGESTYAVYIICRDRPRNPATDQVMNWADKITEFLDGNKFGLNFISSARIHTVNNPYNSEQDLTGIAYAEIRFECPMVLEAGNLNPGVGTEDGGQGDPGFEVFTDNQRDISILRRTVVAPGVGSFELTTKRAEILTVKATVKTLEGLQELDRVALTTVNATHEFTIPYNTLGIDTSCDVRLGDTILAVKDVENQNEQNQFLILRCAALGSETKAAN